MKVMVTGGAGFIGSHLTEELLERGFQVIVYDDFSSGKRENLAGLAGELNIAEDTILNMDELIKRMEGCRFVFHEAALTSVPRSMERPLDSLNVNVQGTYNVLEAARQTGVKKVIFASSSSIYGASEKLPKEETDGPAPISPYAASKYAGEILGQTYNRAFGLGFIGLRYFNVFGPRQDPESQYAAVIPKFITAMLNGDRPVAYGDGKQSRDFTYVKNVVNANTAAMESGVECGVYNTACGDRIDLLQLIEAINNILDKNIKPIFSDPRPGDVRHSLAALHTIKKELGYEPSVSFEQGIKMTVEQYRQE